MTTSNLAQAPKEFNKMLLEIGFMACMNGYSKEAEAIFSGIPKTSENRFALKMGAVMTLMAKGAFLEAKARLYEVLESNEPITEDDRQTLMGFRGIIEYLLGDHTANLSTMEALGEAQDPTVRNLAKAFVQMNQNKKAGA